MTKLTMKEFEVLAKQINRAQRKLLDELMGKIGLEEVKHVAMQLYSDTLLLRKRCKKVQNNFAAEVASLTRGRKGVGPPPTTVLRRGMPVEVRAPNRPDVSRKDLTRRCRQECVCGLCRRSSGREDHTRRNVCDRRRKERGGSVAH